MPNAERDPEQPGAPSSAHWRRLRDLFCDVQEVPEPDRAAFLDRELAGQPALRAELDSFLASARTAGTFLAPPGAVDAVLAASAAPLPPGSFVGPYRIVALLGAGGFGVVYLAEQERPLRRRVALKLIKPGMDTRQVIARFETERQSLALMDHRSIAQVYDAGATDAGRPFFAMEFVPGVPITTFCDDERLSIRDRLVLFLDVCDAVQHAHQRAIIHRDLKPSNILVGRRDGVPLPKVIDFGIVKATGSPAGDRTLLTREGMVLGTLGYMSPEQAGAIPADVDTRSDIYSLGVVLYELLTGELPFDRARLQRVDWTEALRIIREEEPPSPTAKLTRGEPATSAGDRTERAARTAEIAGRRGADGRTLLRELHGELEWITLRALEKEPERRYPSASELSADIRRYLADEPVLARAPSTMYRIRTFARRHRAGVAAAALLLLAIVAGGVTSAVGFSRAVRAEHAARREAEAASQVSDYLVSLFRASTPDRARGETITARTLLEEGTQRIRDSVKGDPRVRARLLTTLGSAHLNLALDEEGLGLLREALAVSESAAARDPEQVVGQLYELAHGLRVAGRYHDPEIGELMDRALAILQESGNRRPDLLAKCLRLKGASLNDRGDRAAAEPLIERAIALAEAAARPDTLELLSMYGTWGHIAGESGQPGLREQRYLRALALAESFGESPSWTVDLHQRLADHYSRAAEHGKAQVHTESAVRLAREIYPPDHPGVATALKAKLAALQARSDYEGALVVARERLDILRKSTRRADLAEPLNSMATLHYSLGRADSAVTYAEEAVAIRAESFGARSLKTAEFEGNLAIFFSEAGRTARAESSFQRVIAVYDSLEPASPYNAQAYAGYANLCRDGGRFTTADSLYAHAESIVDSTHAFARRALGGWVVQRAYLRLQQRRHTEADSMAANGIRLFRGGSDEPDPALGNLYVCWAAIRAGAGDPAGAMEKLRIASDHGADESVAQSYPELAAIRERSDYPLRRDSS
jgi:non-specific serine/threonine protein kinase/serine/threonine-protein kinase